MALDTEKRRRMALGFASGVGIILPIADGTIDTADRAIMLGCWLSVPADLYRESYATDSSITRSDALNSHALRGASLNSRLDD